MTAAYPATAALVGTAAAVVAQLLTANHDPAFFTHPDVANFTRKGTTPMSFGYGRHYCLGAPLARLELKSVLAQMIPRFPDMRLLVDAAELSVNIDSLGSGLGALPVTWG